MLNELLLLSKNDIPFPQAELVIHQPTIKQIGYIGQDSFYTGCGLLNFSKQNYDVQGNNNLANKTDFDILMSILSDPNPECQEKKTCLEMLLLLIFPQYTARILPNCIGLIKDDRIYQINNKNFDKFRQIIRDIFVLRQVFKNVREYNPGNARAKALAQQFNRYHQKLAKMKNKGGEGQKVTILSRYISILAVGENKNINDLLDYSVYQLFDEFQRYKLKYESDVYKQMKIAGAKDLKEPKNWMEDLYSDNNTNQLQI